MSIWEHGNNIWEHMNLIIYKYESGELGKLYGLPRWPPQYALCPPLPSTTYRTCNINLKFNMQHFTFDRSTRDDPHLIGVKHIQCLHVLLLTPKPSIKVITGTP